MIQKKILITGSTGFIGSKILEEFSKNNKIYIILRNKKKIKRVKNLNIIYYRDFDNLNFQLKKIKVDIIVHCATHYVKEHSYNDIQKLSNSNILFGNIILENLNHLKVKKFINLSTVWEDYNSIRDDNPNLYAVYKKNFTHLINFYKKKFVNISFYTLMISDTFGTSDRRNKLINVLRNNYKKNNTTKIISKNLYINLLNVEDIVNAVDIIIKKNIKPDQYVLKNKEDFKIGNIINSFNKFFTKKIKITWMSNKTIKHKIYPYQKLNNWTPTKSKLKDILNIINK